MSYLFATATFDAGLSLQSTSAGGLGAVDWVIIAIYAGATIGLGYYYSRRQRSTEEYFVGNRRMNPTLIGVSLFATLLSTITYLALPGEIIAKGPSVIIASMVVPLLVFPIVGYLVLPVYMRQRVTSAYELLEERLGVGIRLLGASMFLALRLTWMSLLVYAAAVAMTVMLGVGKESIPLIVVVTALVSVTYTSLGGLRAVVITDLVQTLLLLIGALLVIVIVTIEMGGFGWYPTQWQSHWDHQPLFSFDPKTRITVIGRIIQALVWYVCTYSSDQTTVQRFMATGDIKAARKAFLMQLIVGFMVATTLWHVGFALMGYFQANPDALTQGLTLMDSGDQIFPYYIAFHLPVGVSGLVVAAMFAAAMSSIDSGVNSMTAVITTDFLERFSMQPKTEKGRLLMTRSIVFGIGAVVVVGSCWFIGDVRGNILAMTSKTAELLIAPIFALFFFARFVTFATRAGVVAGMICGVTTAILIAFSGSIFGMDYSIGEALDPVSFMWIGPGALLVNIVVGTWVSLIFKKR